jgi:hypothetical protein
MKAHRVVRYRGSHIFYPVGSQMAVKLSALRTGRPLPPGRFLVLISVRGWVGHRAIVWLEGLGQLTKSNGLIRNWARDLPARSIVPQPTMLPHAPKGGQYLKTNTVSWEDVNTILYFSIPLHDIFNIQYISPSLPSVAVRTEKYIEYWGCKYIYIDLH